MSFEVARSEDAVYVRVQGLGSMKTAPTLEAFVDAQVEEGARQLVLDLGECSGVDSTFMGTLLGVSNRLRELGPGAGVALINVDAHARKQLSSVGVDAFVKLVDGETELPGRLKLTELPTRAVSDKERLKLMVRAHKDLVAADERNKAKFGAFLEAIIAELE
ncbi:MAG: STAS domain-containing protein [Planctomycetota bacterium]